ncbi:hypothetical protein IAF16_17160 [Acinetobacter baumannii]|nr:hypothetical protein [Acinetobacter baumannii]
MSNSLFINGVWLQGSGTTFVKTNPVDNQTVWSGAEATASDVEKACQSLTELQLMFPKKVYWFLG